jgi:hypothetical protein
MATYALLDDEGYGIGGGGGGGSVTPQPVVTPIMQLVNQSYRTAINGTLPGQAQAGNTTSVAPSLSNFMSKRRSWMVVVAVILAALLLTGEL